jgi:hypothetical protein
MRLTRARLSVNPPKERMITLENHYPKTRKDLNRACFSSSSRSNRTHQTRTAWTAYHHRLDCLDRAHWIPLAGALAGRAGTQTPAAMATIVAIKQRRIEGVSESVSRGRVGLVEAVGEAGDVGKHGGGTAASATQRARRAVNVRVE